LNLIFWSGNNVDDPWPMEVQATYCVSLNRRML
jgi:hypothetical protein